MKNESEGEKLKKANIKLRFNIINTIVYVVSLILILQLFNLQIVNGEEYREKSNTKLSRESKLEAARGSILDKTGNKLATTKMGFSLELYKSKVDNETLNESILKMIKILEENEDTFTDTLPITLEPYGFTLGDEESEKKWKEKNKLDKDLTAEECFNKLQEKYKITNQDLSEVRKIMGLRYEIAQAGYSSTKSVVIAKDISRASANQFNERSAEFPGVNIIVEPIRTYQKGNLASHIIGYIGKIGEKEYETKKEQGYENDDYVGRTGIESVFEEYLKGKDGIKQIDMAVEGTATDEYISQEAVAGSDIVLSIDANLQLVTEQALANNIYKINNGGFGKQYNTNSGAVVVMNVKTGEVLAMASYPDFEPELFVGGISTENWKKYHENSNNPLYNRAVQGAYAPGSIYKMISAVAALESGITNIKEKINDTGVYPYAHKPVCWYWTDYHRGHGYLNVTGAIQHSCNYYFYEMGRRMGIDVLEKYSKYFGLGEKTGIELPNENAGTLASKALVESKGREWKLGDMLSAVIGQSYNNFSPIQIAKYISMIANGGKKINPTIVKSVINADGTEVSKEEIENFVNNKLGLTQDTTEDLNIDDKNLAAVREGMRSVTSETGGTAYSIFKDFNIEVGGKTGSAEAGNKTNAWFAGYAPFDDPEIAVVVMVENGGHGSYTAEVVRDIMAQYFGMNSSQITEDMTAIPYTEIVR